MQCNINKHLLTFKAFLFCFVAAVGAMWPFLTLHMRQLGLTTEEIAVINLILPFVSALTKPFIGLLVDKTGKFKLILTIMLISAGAFNTSLLLVPPVENEQLKSPFTCSNIGAKLLASCPTLNLSNWIDLELNNCNYNCESIETTAENIPSICVVHNRTTTCQMFNAKDKFNIQVMLNSLDNECEIEFIQIKGLIKTIKCPYINNECKLECTSEFPVDKSQSKSNSLTFWLYLSVRIVADAVLSAIYPMSDALNLSLIGQFGGSFGQQHLVGLAALGIFAPFSGFVSDFFSKSQGKETYVSCFVIADVMLLFGVVLLYFIPNMEVKKQKQDLVKGLMLMLTNTSMLVLFFVCVALGVIWGYMEIFLYLYLLDRGGTRLLIGLTQLISVLPAIPCLYKSMWIMDKMGNTNLLIFGFFVYSIRCVGYVVTTNPWWSLLFESTRVFSVYLTRIALALAADSHTQPELQVTTQSLIFMLHFDIGRGVGSLVGGTLKDYLGDKMTFQIIAVYSGLLGCGYLSLYHFYLKYRQPHVHKPITVPLGHKTAQNGYINGEPLLLS